MTFVKGWNNSALFFVFIHMKINLSPYPAAEYFTIREHRRKRVDLHFSESLKSIELILRKLFQFPDHFHMRLASKGDRSIPSERLFLDDPNSGQRTIVSNQPVKCLDLSYSFPLQTDILSLSASKYVLDPSASLGVPTRFDIVFYSAIDAAITEDVDKNWYEDVALLHLVLLDIEEKGMDQLLRECNYKAAVLYQLIESHRELLALVSKENRSKTIVAFECKKEFFMQIERLGYHLHASEEENNKRVALANYATHSKELIEMFADRVAAL